MDIPKITFFILFECSYQKFMNFAEQIQKNPDHIYIFPLYLPSCGQSNIRKSLEEIYIVTKQEFKYTNMTYIVIYLNEQGEHIHENILTRLSKGRKEELFNYSEIIQLIMQTQIEFNIQFSEFISFNPDSPKKVHFL